MPEQMWPQFRMPELNEEETNLFHDEIIDQLFAGLCEEVLSLPLPDINRFSRFNRLIRATAYSWKMINAAKAEKTKCPTKQELFTLNLEEIEEAKQKWYQRVQAEVYSKELADLKNHGFVKKSSTLFTHSPFIHKGIIRLQGRIQDSLLTFDENNPVILPAKHRFTQLLMEFYHEQNLHGGVNSVINNLRQFYDIIGVKPAVKKIFSSCRTCRKLRGKARPPQMGNLPSERTSPYVPAFSNIGLDYLGPYQVTVGRRHEKRWVALFTDLVSRACHAEVVSTLSTDSAIKAIFRFINCRGVPSLFISDNATCFKGADNELKAFFDQVKENLNKINDQLSLKGFTWKFIPPASPHFGGVYERKVQSVKRVLNVALSELFPNDETFATAISHVINTINNTPIGEISSDATEARALTPNDLILGKNNNTAVNVDNLNVKLDRNSWKTSQTIADRFWIRWIKECRPLLQRRTKWYNNKNTVELKLNDVVLIADETSKRNTWPLGIVVTTYPGKDMKVRTATIRTASGEYKRPVVKLILVHRPEKETASEGPENVDK